MSLLRRHLVLAAAAASLGLASLAAQAADPAKPNLTLGATAGYNYDVLKKAIAPQLEKEGYKVRLVEFNDYVQPNLALAQGSLDANLFQHITYLNRFKADQKLDLVDLVQSTTAPMGIYSESRKSLAELQDGDRVTLPNDPSNLARALQLLVQQDLITVKADIDPLRVSERDVVENPKKLRFQPIEAAQLPRTLGDAAIAIVPGNFATAAGLAFTSALALEQPPVAYQQVVAVRQGDEAKPWAQDLKKAFQSPFFKQVLDAEFPGYTRPAGL
ncbi:metal ABC transporter substrate-binding protein [Corticibacter populi]|uniref:Lipoprotein n=1 Tax=Corticibacter populi TaxID=1550736 RepID=A0A3M6QSP8_9BURK|nr:MetQ/NlpA family ABC transporter substrate-binding protein [Corticibacter populi]RMX06055.1 metal ABC transporter substrate-binding protein [Corticibacter populi]RZS30762.1 D-methionine transport system substrate-binding protein [Corticibacter populi]